MEDREPSLLKAASSRMPKVPKDYLPNFEIPKAKEYDKELSRWDRFSKWCGQLNSVVGALSLILLVIQFLVLLLWWLLRSLK